MNAPHTFDTPIPATQIEDGRCLTARATGPTDLSPASGSSQGSVPIATLVDEIVSHLGAAISQSIPTDDQRIMEHVRAAHGLARILRRAA